MKILKQFPLVEAYDSSTFEVVTPNEKIRVPNGTDPRGKPEDTRIEKTWRVIFSAHAYERAKDVNKIARDTRDFPLGSVSLLERVKKLAGDGIRIIVNRLEWMSEKEGKRKVRHRHGNSPKDLSVGYNIHSKSAGLNIQITYYPFRDKDTFNLVSILPSGFITVNPEDISIVAEGVIPKKDLVFIDVDG